MSRSGHKLPIKNAKGLASAYIYSLRLDNPKWHPDWKKNLGYKLAKILFLAGATEIKHNIHWNTSFDINAAQPPLHKQTIYVYPHIDSSIDALKIKDKNDKNRPLIWTLLQKFGIGITGCANENFTQLSSVKEMELYSDIVLHFKYFQDHFVLQ